MSQNPLPTRPLTDGTNKPKSAIRKQLIPRIRFPENIKPFSEKEGRNILTRNQPDPKTSLEAHSNSNQRKPSSSRKKPVDSSHHRSDPFGLLDPKVRELLNLRSQNLSFSKIQQQLNKRPPFLRFKQSKRKILSTAKLSNVSVLLSTLAHSSQNERSSQLFSLHVYQNNLPQISQNQILEDSNTPYTLEAVASHEVFGILKHKIPTLPPEVRHKWERNTFTTVSIATFGRKRFKMKRFESESKSRRSGGLARTKSDNNIAAVKERKHHSLKPVKEPKTQDKHDEPSHQTRSLLASKADKLKRAPEPELTKESQTKPVALVASPLPPNERACSPRVRTVHNRVRSAQIGSSLMKSCSISKVSMFPDLVTKTPVKTEFEKPRLRNGRFLEHEIRRILSSNVKHSAHSSEINYSNMKELYNSTNPALFQRYLRQAQRV